MKLFQNVNWIVNRWRTVTVWCLAMLPACLPACVAFGNKPNDSNNNSNTPACCRYTHKCGYNTCEYVLPGIATINTKSYTSIVVCVCVCVSARMSASVSCIWLLLHLPDKSCRPDQLYLTSHIHAYIYGLFFSIFVHTYSSLLSQFPKFTQFLATPYRLKIFPLNHWEVSSRDCDCLFYGGPVYKAIVAPIWHCCDYNKRKVFVIPPLSRFRNVRDDNTKNIKNVFFTISTTGIDKLLPDGTASHLLCL